MSTAQAHAALANFRLVAMLQHEKIRLEGTCIQALAIQSLVIGAAKKNVISHSSTHAPSALDEEGHLAMHREPAMHIDHVAENGRQQ